MADSYTSAIFASEYFEGKVIESVSRATANLPTYGTYVTGSPFDAAAHCYGANHTIQGSGAYVHSLIPDANLDFGTGDFTVDGWVYIGAPGAGNATILKGIQSVSPFAQTFFVGFNASGWLQYIAGGTSTSSPNPIEWYKGSTGWIHIEVSRASGTTRLFVHGTVAVTRASDTGTYNLGADQLFMMNGTLNSVQKFYNIRISKGIARHTANFTPPTTPLPSEKPVLVVTGAVSASWTPSSTQVKNKNVVQAGAVSLTWTPGATMYKNKNLSQTGAVSWAADVTAARQWYARPYGDVSWTITPSSTQSITAHPPVYFPQTASGALAKTLSVSIAAYGGARAQLSKSSFIGIAASSNVYAVPKPINVNLRGPILSLAVSMGINWRLNGPTPSLIALGTTYQLPGARLSGPSYSLQARSGGAGIIPGPTTTINASSTVITLATARIRAPQTVISSTIQTGNLGRASINLYSVLSVQSFGGAVFNNALKLPAQLTASSTINGFAVANIAGPDYSITASSTISARATAVIRAPILESRYCVARISAPILSITASTVKTTGHTVAYVVNLENAAVTQYLNYAFDNIVNFGNKFYGVKADGIYLLEGATDAGASIPATVTLPPIDLGTSQKKRVSDVYVDTGDATVLTPNVDGTDIGPYTSIFAGRKTQFGKGAKGRYWGLKVENYLGGEMSINSIEIESTQTRRVD